MGMVKPVKIEDEMRSSYIDYAMSVIVSRALPDVRDGLKPVHRRILFGMNEMGVRHNTAFKKSARIVGDVMGKYHPHGDSSVYDAMVRMAQDFSMRYPLVDGQGNFGSMDNDPAAAMRYTEARMTRIAEMMMQDIDKNTVDFMPNFDESLREPTVLPTRLPSLLLNGSSGIAVGMATNIPPHNLTELCDAISFLIDNPNATIDDLTHLVKGPDFPTAGVIIGRDGIRNAYATGRGKVVVRAKAHVADIPGSGRRQIVITELPYQTNKASLVESIARLVKNKKIEGISELRDESDRQGLRVVIELRREAQPQKVLNNLYKHTSMQTGFYVNMLALVDGQPKVISLKEALNYFICFRREVITRRTKYELKEARARAHILEGFKIALDNIDEIIATIRQSQTVDIARKSLMEKFSLSQIQSQAILDMQLRRLANLERQKILDEYAELLKKIAYLEDLLANRKKILALIKDEILEVKDKYGDERRTTIVEQGLQDFTEEDLIPHETVVITVSERGFIKRESSTTYSVQKRGGRGKKGHGTLEEDSVRLLRVADTHDDIYFFTNKGKVFYLKGHEVPAGSSRTAKGIAVINLFSINENERITAMITVSGFEQESYLVMATAMGEIKRTSVDKFSKVRVNGLIAMDLEAEDELISVIQATDDEDVIIATRKGKSIRFPVTDIRASSRTSGGVRAIKLGGDDVVVSMNRVDDDGYLLVVSELGLGKLTALDQYPKQHRGGMGVKTFNTVAKSGDVSAAEATYRMDQLMIISLQGIVERTNIKDISVQGRSTQGVKIMNLDDGDKIVAIATFDVDNDKAAKAAKSDISAGDGQQGTLL